MNAPERFEQLIAFIGATLPGPVERQTADDGTVLFTGGSPGEVVVRLTHTAVIVSEYAGAPAGAFSRRPRRLGVLRWRRLPEPALMNALAQLIAGAREVRRARYRTCRFCELTHPPEWMHTEEVCLGCSTQQMNTIH